MDRAEKKTPEIDKVEMMKKKLSEMTLEELWQLFPIVLTEHQACWEDWYAEEERLLKE